MDWRRTTKNLLGEIIKRVSLAKNKLGEVINVRESFVISKLPNKSKSNKKECVTPTSYIHLEQLQG